MAPDVLGPDDIEVDGDISRPSDPTPYKKKCFRVFAPIAFSVRKSFWKKFWGNGVTSVRSVDFIDLFSKHSKQCESDARDLFFLKNKKPTEKTIGGLPL